MAVVDIVVVSFNSRDKLRACVGPMSEWSEVRVIVVDNASSDGSLAAIEDLPIDRIQLFSNRGFSHGCNVGWRLGQGPYVLFLNPDARIDMESLGRLVRVLDDEEGVGVVGPAITDPGGTLDFSQRRFARLRSTYAQALFLHRLFPRAAWTDEMVRDPARYDRAGDVEWLSGACLLVRRTVLTVLGGFDERFFMYCEDQDLCRAAWDLGVSVRYEPSARCVHEGGASAPSERMLPVLARSRVIYAQKHSSTAFRYIAQAGIALSACTHMLLTRGGRTARAGHARALLHTAQATRKTLIASVRPGGRAA